jgi:LAO/AO transport system kinase
MIQEQLALLQKGNYKALARVISLVENEAEGYERLLQSLPANKHKVVGITGPPGAGKSTLTDALIKEITIAGKTVGILCVDPSSPFNLGALLGDRIRMSEWYTHPSVYIRSLGTRGSLGGLHPKIIEITDVMKAANFDYIIVETVGVGQSEIEIAGLADVTVVVVVPEAGDEIQTMKAGLMEIADIFVVNKADRPGANTFANNLQKMYSPAFSNHKATIPIIKTIASQSSGIDALHSAVNNLLLEDNYNEKKYHLLTDKAYFLIQQKRMKDIDKKLLKAAIQKREGVEFNLYRFVDEYIDKQGRN